jgi:G3E family GTPase
VHRLFEIYALEPWGDLHRDSRMVFIGKDLDRDALTNGLAACSATDQARVGDRR